MLTVFSKDGIVVDTSLYSLGMRLLSESKHKVSAEQKAVLTNSASQATTKSGWTLADTVRKSTSD